MSTEDLIKELERSGVLEGGRSPVHSPRNAPTAPSPPTLQGPRLRSVGMLVAVVLLVALLGSLPFGSYLVYPFALFVTLVHETSHAVAATLTGGVVDSVRIAADLSGVTMIRGGLEPIVASAGYVGAAGAGAAALLVPPRYSRAVVASFAAVPLAVLAVFHPADLFTAAWSVVFAAALAVAAWKLPRRLVPALQLFLAAEIGLNAVRDLGTLILISSTDAHMHTDAVNMSRALFLPPAFWSVLWTVLSVVLLASALVLAVKREMRPSR